MKATKLQKTPLSRTACAFCALSVLVAGAAHAAGLLPAALGALFAVPLLALLLLRGSVALACLASGAYVALAFLFGSFSLMITAAATVLGAAAFARGVREGEDRSAGALTLSFILILGGVAALALLLWGDMAAAGKTDPVAYLREQMDGLVALSVTEYMSSMEALFAGLVEANPELADQIRLPSSADVTSLFTQIYSLLPACAVLLVAAFSIICTYLFQLFSMLTDNEKDGPLYTEANRAFSLGAVLAVSYILCYLVNLIWRDYTSVISLTLMNAEAVLSCLFAFGGLRYIPRILHGMRRAEGGRPAYIIWFVLFLILCLVYFSYALTILGLAYAVSILKNAIRSLRGTDKKG